MDLFSLDFESPYCTKTGYTLTKMSTEDYVCDPRFDIFMCSVVRTPNGDPARVEPGYLLEGTRPQIIEDLRALDLHRHAVVAQNMLFDGLILEQRCKIIPKLYLDTLSMARPILGSYSKRLSLGALAKFFKLGEKGDEVVRADGKLRREDFTPYEWAEYGKYCVNDAMLCWRIYQRMRRHARPFAPPGVAPNGEWWMDSKNAGKLIPFEDSELRTIDATMRMYTQPKLVLNKTRLEANLVKTREKKAKILAEAEVQGITAKVLRSTQQFAALLESMGVEVPLKPSPADLKNGKNPPRMVPAFGKTDEGFKALIEEYEDDPTLSAFFAARLSEKSTMEERRTESLIHIAGRYPRFRVPIGYCKAHTTRDGGEEGINAQNFPGAGKSEMRFAIEAPPGHVIVDADQAQIEARLVAVCAGQTNLVQQFRDGKDVYSLFASEIYKRPIDRKKKIVVDGKTIVPDEKEGKVGKEGILGLGFEMGAEKFRLTLAGKAGVKEPIEVVKDYVDTYRTTYAEIPKLWAACKAALGQAIMHGTWTDVACVQIGPEGIRFPNGMMIHYPNLDWDGRRYTYQRAKDKYPKGLFGGAVTENFIQKLARDIVFSQANKITRETGYRHVLRAHDAIAHVVPEDKAEAFGKVVLEIMSEPPIWLPNVPLLAELKIGRSYGDT